MMKTYISPGLLDWHLRVCVGKATVNVHFSGGHLGPNGMKPASFSTDQAALQKIIEESPQFRRGRIVIHKDMTFEKRKSCSSLE